MSKNAALIKLDSYNTANKGRIYNKYTIDDVAQETSEVMGTGNEVTDEYLTSGDDQLKTWLLLRAAAISLLLILLLVLALHYKVIKI